MIEDFVVANNIDFLGVMETWLQSETDNELIICDLCAWGCSFHHVPRHGPACGGGVSLEEINCVCKITKICCILLFEGVIIGVFGLLSYNRDIYML